jgi:hypothetical protein
LSTVIGWAYLLIGVGGIYSAARFSYAEWRAARRDKNFWLVALGIFGPIFILPYLLAIRPQLQLARLVLLRNARQADDGLESQSEPKGPSA